jgi:predicted anti-sigma-YlaC factor YlaD
MNRVTCEEAFRQLDDYLDRELGAVETRLIEEHLSICGACLREFTFERSVVDGVRR